MDGETAGKGDPYMAMVEGRHENGSWRNFASNVLKGFTVPNIPTCVDENYFFFFFFCSEGDLKIKFK